MSVNMQTYQKYVIPLLTEFTSQFMLTFWGSMAMEPYDEGSKNQSSHAEESSCCVREDEYLKRVFMPALQSGLGVWMNIVVFHKISGAHFNPAISIGFLVAGVLKPIMFIPYVIAQCIGSVAAAAVAKALLDANPAIIAVPDHVPTSTVFFSELFITAMLIFCVLPMVVDETYDQHTGFLAVGLSVFQGLLSGRWIGVACISPSRAFGPAVVVGGAAWNRHWLLWIADLAGGSLAALYYMIFFAPPKKLWLSRFRAERSKGNTGRSHELETMVDDETKLPDL